VTTRRRRRTRTGGTPTRRYRTSRYRRSGHRTPVRRPRRSTAATFGTAFGLLLVAAILRGSWPVRIGVVLVGLACLLAYALITRRASAVGVEGGATDVEPEDVGG
jgi:hypothetical protein